MDTVLGVSMAPTAVRMVLVEGENGDGVTVDEDNFDVAADDDAATLSAADQVVSAILGTQEGAAQGGYQLTSTGVTWTDPIEAAALRDALAAHKVENVMLVSAFLAAAALAQAVGNETNYAQTALLFIEPDSATLAIVDTSDGSIADVLRQALPEDDDAAVAQLATMVSSAETLETRPGAVFVVGSGMDIPLIKPTLEAATTLPVTVPEEPETALARGAALASANAPLFVSSTAARAYAQDPGTGAIDPLAVAPAYSTSRVPATTPSRTALSHDDFAEPTPVRTPPQPSYGADYRERRSFGLVGSAVAAIFIVGVAALVVSLAIAIRPTAGVKPVPGQNIVAPPTAPQPRLPAPAAAPAAPAAPAPEAAPIAGSGACSSGARSCSGRGARACSYPGTCGACAYSCGSGARADPGCSGARSAARGGTHSGADPTAYTSDHRRRLPIGPGGGPAAGIPVILAAVNTLVAPVLGVVPGASPAAPVAAAVPGGGPGGGGVAVGSVAAATADFGHR